MSACYDAEGRLLPLHRRLTLGALREVVAGAATRLRNGKQSLVASVEQRWLAPEDAHDASYFAASAKIVSLCNSFRITQQRGEPQETRFAPHALATYHPSAILRVTQRDPEAGAQIERHLREDLASISAFL